MARSLYPVPSFKGAGPLDQHIIVDQRGWRVADGFPTIHHAWHWIIGPSYRWPRYKITGPHKGKRYGEKRKHDTRRVGR